MDMLGASEDWTFVLDGLDRVTFKKIEIRITKSLDLLQPGISLPGN